MAAQPLPMDDLHAPATASREMNDIELLHEGERALEERLGPEGLLRFLQLLGDGRRRFEDIRKEWAGLSMDEAIVAMGIPTTAAGSPK